MRLRRTLPLVLVLVPVLVLEGRTLRATPEETRDFPEICKGFKESGKTTLTALFGGYELRHADAVLAVAFSTSSRAVYSASEDKTVKVWDVKTGKETKTIRYDAPVRTLAVLPEGRLLTAGDDKTIRILDVDSWKVVKTIGCHEGAVRDVKVSQDGKRALSLSVEGAADDGKVRVWDLEAGEVVRTIEVDNAFSGIAISPDGKRGMTLRGGHATIWNLDTGEEIANIPEQQETLKAGALTADDEVALTGTGESVVIWDLSRQAHRERGIPGDASAVVSATLSSRMNEGEHIASLIVSRDGTQVLAGTEGYGADLWDLASPPDRGFLPARMRSRPAEYRPAVLTGCSGGAHPVAFSSDGERIVMGGKDGTVRVFDMTTATGAPLDPNTGHRSGIASVAISPDGEQILTGSTDGTIRRWSPAGRERRTYPTDPSDTGYWGEAVRSVGFSEDGREVFCATARAQLLGWGLLGKTRVAQHGVETWAPAGESEREAVVGRRGSTDVALVFTPKDGKLSLYRLERSCHRLRHLSVGKGVRAIALCPDGKSALAGDKDGSVKICDLSYGFVDVTLEGHTKPITALAYCPSEVQALSGDAGGEIVLWDLDGKKKLRALKGHKDAVTALAFSPPDGKRALTAARDGTIRLWNLETGEELDKISLDSSTDHARALAFSPDGKWFVAGTARGVALRFDFK